MDADHDFEIEALYEVPEDFDGLGVTAAGNVFGLTTTPDDRIRLLWDGEPSAPFDDIGRSRDDQTQYWSGDGRHVAMVAIVGDGVRVIRDGVASPWYSAVSGSVRPTLSHDGSRLAVGVEIDGEWRLVVDDVVVGTSPLAPIEVAFSAEGTRLAYAELRESGRDPAFQVVLDDAAGPLLRGMGNARGALRFSPDGRRFACHEVDGNGKARWLVDGVAQQWVHDQGPVNLARVRAAILDPPLPASFSPDGRRFAYQADIPRIGVAVIEDDQVGMALRASGPPVFSPDSLHLAYLGIGPDGLGGIVLDGEWGARVPLVGGGTPVFTADSRHVAATFVVETGSFLRRREAYGVARDRGDPAVRPGRDVGLWPAWGPDGTSVAWWVERAKGSFDVIADGRPILTLKELAGDPTFTSTGRVVVAGASSEGWTVFVDGVPGPWATAPLPVFPPERLGPYPEQAAPAVRISPDGEHVAWAGSFAAGERPVLDARRGPWFREVFGCEFAADGTAVWWAQDQRRIVRVTAEP